MSSSRLEYSRGDSFATTFSVITRETGVPLNIAGATLLFTVNTEKNPADATNQVFQVAGAITDAVNGKFTVEPSSSNTNITPGEYYYDIQMTLAGKIRTLHKDIFVIIQDITK